MLFEPLSPACIANATRGAPARVLSSAQSRLLVTFCTLGEASRVNTVNVASSCALCPLQPPVRYTIVYFYFLFYCKEDTLIVSTTTEPTENEEDTISFLAFFFFSKRPTIEGFKDGSPSDRQGDRAVGHHGRHRKLPGSVSQVVQDGRTDMNPLPPLPFPGPPRGNLGETGMSLLTCRDSSSPAPALSDSYLHRLGPCCAVRDSLYYHDAAQLHVVRC